MSASAEQRPEARLAAAARRLLAPLLAASAVPVALRLWDGSRVEPPGVAPAGTVAIGGPGVLGAILARPGLDTLFRAYVTGGLELVEGDLLSLFRAIARSKRTRRPSFWRLAAALDWASVLPLWRARTPIPPIGHALAAGERPAGSGGVADTALIRFHYDVGNDFYALFLDPEMVYSCGYFREPGGDLATAQRDKLELVCRKLRLRPGLRLLDIGCGWGALLIHAARYHRVLGHGVTLSAAQAELARARVAEAGLAGQVTIELRDYREVSGTYDRIASIGMYEHVGIARYPEYFRKIRDLLADDGVFLNHGITRRAKSSARRFRRPSASRRIILRYIFPGSDLDQIGHTLEVMEEAGFEIHDVEGLRRHYARTCELWYQRLQAARAEAERLAGAERTRMWLAYLAGVAVGFADGPLRLFQVVATRRGASVLPWTREDLYTAWPADGGGSSARSSSSSPRSR